MNRTTLFTVLTGLCLTFGASQALALTIDGTGQVTDWNLTPFSQPNGSSQTGNRVSTIANDYAPIRYSSTYAYKPSGGENWDLEEMHARISTDGQLQVLVVNSSGIEKNGWILGDLMMTVNGQRFAVVTNPNGRGYDQGDVIALTSDSDVDILQDKSGSYLNNNTLRANDYGPDDKVRNIAGPWRATDGLPAQQLIADALIAVDTFDYTDEAGTSLIEYTLDLTDLTAATTFEYQLQLTWGCGNDVIRVEGETLTPIPEPSTLGLAALGVMQLCWRRRRPHAA
jgi:hypothetical protein